MTSHSKPAETSARNTNTVRDEARFRDFAEAASDWFFEMDEDLRFTYVSERHQEVLGVTPDQVIGRTRWEAHAHRRLPEEDALWQKHIETMRAHRSWKEFTYTIVRDDGERRVICNSAKAIFDDTGTFRGYRGVGRDVTHQVSADARLRAVINTVPDAIITIDENGTVNSFSPAAERVFGYTAGEVVGQNVKMLMPSPYHDEHDGYIAHYRATGEKKIIGIGREVEARRKDGSVFPINLAVNEMLVDGQCMFTGVIQDISTLRQAQSASLRLDQILDHSLNEIFIFDATTLRFAQVNSGARRNLGYSIDELLDMTPVDIKPEFDAGEFAELIESLRDGSEEQIVFRTIHERKDGTTYPVEVHLQLMAEESPPVFVAIILDISEVERREAMLRQAQKMEAVGQLTGGIAHDFNNLLTVILGNSELLMMQLEENDTAQKLLADAIDAAERGSELTGQLLAFARQQPLSPKVIDLNELVLKMMDLLRRTLGETIRLSTVLATDLGKTLADPVQVHNALLNLAINARDAMPGGGELIIETSNADLDGDSAAVVEGAAPGAYVRLSVRDSGCGMPPDVQAQAFDPFFTTKDTGKGTGLGLSMVHGFAKQSDGHVSLYSEVGHGTSISLYLPDTKGESGSTDARAGTRPPEKTTGERILVVEDDHRVRAVTVRRLEHLGYRPVEASNAAEAMEYLEGSSDPVDLLFTDIVMPGGTSGIELAQDVRTAYPDMKIVLTSGYAQDGLLATKDLPWLRKPFALSDLARTLHETLHGNESQRTSDVQIRR
ncbi:MAG: PAS domain S-box protein [Hyphomicrobiaceae bacterium]